MKPVNPNEALQYLVRGQIVAYPTEAVYGVGCDPFNQHAVEKILQLKHRSFRQGLIVLIGDWLQLDALIQPIAPEKMLKVQASWPGPTTWIFPKSAHVPLWISGEHDSVAVRMSAHPVARQLCQHGPIVSTSANKSGEPPAKSIAELHVQFPQGVDVVVDGELGGAAQPSAVFDVLTDTRWR